LDLIDRVEFDSLTTPTNDKNTVIIGDNRYSRTHVISQLREGVSLTTEIKWKHDSPEAKRYLYRGGNAPQAVLTALL
ncbi:MAG: hypothetical protein ACRDBG_03900, partial [Waterburya sp.]